MLLSSVTRKKLQQEIQQNLSHRAHEAEMKRLLTELWTESRCPLAVSHRQAADTTKEQNQRLSLSFMTSRSSWAFVLTRPSENQLVRDPLLPPQGLASQDLERAILELGRRVPSAESLPGLEEKHTPDTCMCDLIGLQRLSCQ